MAVETLPDVAVTAPARSSAIVSTRKAEIDTLNAAGAAALAAKIRAFWGSMGWAVRVDVVPQGRANGDALYGIRSDLLSAASTAIITVNPKRRREVGAVGGARVR